MIHTDFGPPSSVTPAELVAVLAPLLEDDARSQDPEIVRTRDAPSLLIRLSAAPDVATVFDLLLLPAPQDCIDALW